jgi:hypothetical protein
MACLNHRHTDKADGKGPVRRARVYRSHAEKRRIVELTFAVVVGQNLPFVSQRLADAPAFSQDGFVDAGEET